MDNVLDRTAHRPWPLPDRPWSYAQRWDDLLFAHRPLPPDTLRPLVPPVLPLDTFDGSAWIGVVPFRLRWIRPRAPLPWPAVPGISRFPELNVRTYVTLDGRPGVYFFSLDAASVPAVLGARLAFRLPYFRAAMTVRRGDRHARRERGEGEEREEGEEEGAEVRDDEAAAAIVVYRSRRKRGWLGAGGGPRRDAAPTALGERPELDASYRPTGPVSHASPSSLAHFLTERYCLYAVDRRERAFRVDIHHPPWPLQPAEAELRVDTMADAAGIDLSDSPPPVMHFSRRQEMVGWMPERVR